MASGHKGVKEARFDLIPQDALWFVARVFGKGAEKYAERNWERGLKYTSIAGARDRHNALFASGEEIDSESGLPHLAHSAWHGLVMLALYLRGDLEDDRGNEVRSGPLTAEVTNPEDIEAARAEVEDEITDFVTGPGGLSGVPCDNMSPDNWFCERLKGHDGPHACPEGNCNAFRELRWP